MKLGKTGIAAIAIAMTVGVGDALASEDIGKREYDNNCAVCHGPGGKGDGPYAGIIDTMMPDITLLQKQNKGVFPFDRVYRTIDGRMEVKAHGPRDMPIWGNEYNDKAVDYYSDYIAEYNAAGFVRGRILALVNHIYTLQAE